MNERFFQGVRSNKVRISVGELELPVHYYDVEAMMSFFPVPARAVVPLLPSPDLQPALYRPGISFLGVASMEYKKSSIGAYNELALVIPSLFRPQSNWPLLPFLFPKWFLNFGGYVLRLPVSTEFASTAGREIWGFPKFIADIEIEERDTRRICTLSHEGALVLRYSLEKPSVLRYTQRAYPVLSCKGESLLKTQLITQGLLGVSKKAAGVELQFGRHALGLELSELHPGPARLSYYYPKLQGLLGWASKSFEAGSRTKAHRGGAENAENSLIISALSASQR